MTIINQAAMDQWKEIDKQFQGEKLRVLKASKNGYTIVKNFINSLPKDIRMY